MKNTNQPKTQMTDLIVMIDGSSLDSQRVDMMAFYECQLFLFQVHKQWSKNNSSEKQTVDILNPISQKVIQKNHGNI